MLVLLLEQYELLAEMLNKHKPPQEEVEGVIQQYNDVSTAACTYIHLAVDTLQSHVIARMHENFIRTAHVHTYNNTRMPHTWAVLYALNRHKHSEQSAHTYV